MMTVEDLIEYSNAWNDHDADRIMTFHTEDTVFETGGRQGVRGTRYEGIAAVRERFIEVWTDLPDMHFTDGEHFVSGDRGCSEWIFHGTRADGTVVEVMGCDLFTFRDGKIYLKNSLLKNRN